MTWLWIPALVVLQVGGGFLLARRFPPVHRRPADEPTWYAAKTGRQILVHTTEDASIEGVLMQVSPDGLMLMAVRYLSETGAPNLAGEVFIPREKVVLVQAPLTKEN